LRIAVAGTRQAITPDEERQMGRLLEESLEAGSAGFSTGLMYAPGSAAGFEELAPLCALVKKHDALYATHMRSYMGEVVEAVDEQLALARATGCRLQISHLQAAGRANWDLQRRAIEHIEAAAKEGVDVAFDIYPYQCGSTVLTQWLPDWAMDGGMDALVRRIRNREDRQRMADHVLSHMVQRWEDITVTGVATEANGFAVGMTLDAIAARWGVEPMEAMLRLLEEETGAVNVVSFNQSLENQRELLTHPLCTVISDGFYVKGLPHPRLHGTFPELLGRVVRARGWMSAGEAVKKITSQPAARLGWSERGVIRDGAVADLVVFDPAKVGSTATYAAPEGDPVGITAVIRAGARVI
jgi:dihydroorotase/N-acyl-D-amino-acid deacylase